MNAHFDRGVLSEQVDYYNENKGTDLGNNKSRYRAFIANIAWCLVDKERFAEYFNRGGFWETELLTASRCFIVKNPMPVPFRNKERKAFRRLIFDYLDESHTRRWILQPHTLDIELDENDIEVMLRQAYMETQLKRNVEHEAGTNDEKRNTSHFTWD